MSHHLMLVSSRDELAPAPSRWASLSQRTAGALAPALHPGVGRSSAVRRARAAYVSLAVSVALAGGVIIDSTAAGAGSSVIQPASAVDEGPLQLAEGRTATWSFPFAFSGDPRSAPGGVDQAETEGAAVEIVQPATRVPLPVGKGMWMWQPEEVEGGNVAATVQKARDMDVSHIYVRTGSSKSGFYAAPFLDQILPAAHGAGIRVYGWDFPYLWDAGADVERSLHAIRHRTPDGHVIDGFVADIETPSEGTHLTVPGVVAYGQGLRQAVGPDYPLLVAVPRPSSAMIGRYPYAEVIAPYSAVAPMVYWLNRQPDTDVAGAVAWLAQFGKPVLPVGQAYDGAPEGGRPGVPPPDEIQRFMRAAEDAGALAVSFWSWQHADDGAWSAIRDAPEFTLRPAPPSELRAGEVRVVQYGLSELGYSVPVSGAWDDATRDALAGYQRDAGLEPTGELDAATRTVMLAPVRRP